MYQKLRNILGTAVLSAGLTFGVAGCEGLEVRTYDSEGVVWVEPEPVLYEGVYIRSDNPHHPRHNDWRRHHDRDNRPDYNRPDHNRPEPRHDNRPEPRHDNRPPEIHRPPVNIPQPRPPAPRPSPPRGGKHYVLPNYNIDKY